VKRKIKTIANLLLFVSMLMQAVSGMFIYKFDYMADLHRVNGPVLLLLVLAHFYFHFEMIKAMFKKV
jgi:cytochrome b subunit of formate dehydrogenase